MDARCVAVVPCRDLDAAEAWWGRLGFARPAGARDWGGYAMLRDGDGAAVHLRADAGLAPGGAGAFGVYLYSRRVAAIAAAMADCRVGDAVGHRAWGMYEVALDGPDGVLVRVGWDSGDMREDG